MTDLWTTRDLPVLQYLVNRLDALDDHQAAPEEVAEATRLDLDSVRRAFRLLANASPSYVEGIDVDQASWPIAIHRLTERAYRAVGAWPTPEGLADQLAKAFADAADAEDDPARKSKLRAVAEGIGGATRNIALDVITRFIERQAGLS